MKYRLADTVSYTVYQDRTILINHADRTEFEMNRDAGLILEKLDSDNSDLSEGELEFIENLSEYGLVVSNDQKTLSTDEGVLPEVDTESADNSIYDHFKTYASQNLIPINCLFETTYRCPLKCSHCYLQDTEADGKKELSLDEIKTFLDEYKSMGGLYLTLTGGDPFVRGDIDEIFSYARKKRFAVTLMTSGINCNSDKLLKMIEKGVYHFQTSIYGPNADIHDKFTDVEGSFDAAMNAIRLMRKHNVPARAAISINTYNQDYYDEILAMLETEKIPYGINFIMIGTRKGSCGPVELNVDDDTLRNCLRKNSRTGTPHLKEVSGCSPVCDGARSVFSMNPYGDVYPCMEVRDRKAGSIRESSLTEIWNKSDAMESLRNVCFNDLEDCPTCKYRNVCNRCSGFAIKEGKGIKGHSKWDCRYAKTMYEVINEKSANIPEKQE